MGIKLYTYTTYILLLALTCSALPSRKGSAEQLSLANQDVRTNKFTTRIRIWKWTNGVIFENLATIDQVTAKDGRSPPFTSCYLLFAVH